MPPRLPLSLPSWLSHRYPRCRTRVLRFTTTRSPRASITGEDMDFSTVELPPPNPKNARIVPASPSYFSSNPDFSDRFLKLQFLLRQHQTLPTVPQAQAPRVAWRTVSQFRLLVGERIRASKYNKILQILQRLNQIHPAMVPKELADAIQIYKRDIQPRDILRKPAVVDEDGRACGVGRRKSSSAKVYLVQGEGEVLVNGKSINSVFGRIHDRESALWALKATQRISKYNVWALVKGGGLTGQAEAITLGAAKALLVHEPALKPALRRGNPSSLLSSISFPLPSLNFPNTHILSLHETAKTNPFPSRLHHA